MSVWMGWFGENEKRKGEKEVLGASFGSFLKRESGKKRVEVKGWNCGFSILKWDERKRSKQKVLKRW